MKLAIICLIKSTMLMFLTKLFEIIAELPVRSIENSQLDDGVRSVTANAPENLSTLRKLVL